MIGFLFSGLLGAKAAAGVVGGGGGGAVFSLAVADAYALGPAALTFLSDGTYTATQPVSDVDGDWISPGATGIGSDYEIKATLVTGTAPAGASLSTWLNMGTTRQWSMNSPGSCVLSIAIRDVATGTTQVSRSDCSILYDSI